MEWKLHKRFNHFGNIYKIHITRCNLWPTESISTVIPQNLYFVPKLPQTILVHNMVWKSLHKSSSLLINIYDTRVFSLQPIFYSQVLILKKANGEDTPCLKNFLCLSIPWRIKFKIPHAMGQLSPFVTTTEPLCHSYWSPQALEPVLWNKRSQCHEKPAHHSEKQPPLTTTR